MARSSERVAIVTGASSGIGRELARLLAADGYGLALVGRDAEALRRVAEETGRPGRFSLCLPLDLSRPGAAAELHDALRERSGAVEVLVNNAGSGIFGPFAGADLERTLAMMRLNVEAVTHLTRLVLPGMIARRSGRILHVASTAAFQPGPYLAVYYASKAYVLSFSEALHEELRGTGVSSTCLCPGPTRTEFQKRAGMAATRLMTRVPFQEAGVVAEAGYRAMLRGRPLVVSGLTNRLGVWATRLAPRSLLPRIVRRLQE